MGPSENGCQEGVEGTGRLAGRSETAGLRASETGAQSGFSCQVLGALASSLEVFRVTRRGHRRPRVSPPRGTGGWASRPPTGGVSGKAKDTFLGIKEANNRGINPAIRGLSEQKTRSTASLRTKLFRTTPEARSPKWASRGQTPRGQGWPP